jgi:hypothetical protein
MAKSDYLEKKVLDHVLRVAAFTQPPANYVALYTTATTDAGGGTEVTGGSYARQTATFAAATSGAGATSNSSSINFPNMPACTVTYVAIWDAVTAGNLLYHGPLTAPQVIAAGTTFNFAIGELDVTES